MRRVTLHPYQDLKAELLGRSGISDALRRRVWTLVQLCWLRVEEDGLGLGTSRAQLRLRTRWRVARRPGSFLGGVGGREEEAWVRRALPEGLGVPALQGKLQPWLFPGAWRET